MCKLTYFLFALLIVITLNQNLFAGTSTNAFTFSKLTDTTHDCSVVMNSFVKYENVNLSGFNDSTVRILVKDSSKELKIDDIRSITFNGSGFWKGAAIVGGIGFVLGAIMGAQGVNLGSDGSVDGSFGSAIGWGVIIAVPFGLIGGGFGALLAEDQFYDLSKMNSKTKRKKVAKLIREYSDR